MLKEEPEYLSAKSRAILYHLKSTLQAKKLLLDTHICNIFEYRKAKFNQKDFHKIIRKYDTNLMLSEVDQLFKELDEDSNGYVFYENLIKAYVRITDYDNPALQLNRRSKIVESPTKKKEMNVLIEIKDLLIQTEDYLEAIQVFITEKDGFLTRENVLELMNSFEYTDPEKQKIVLDSLFGSKHKIEFVDLLKALDLHHEPTRINLSEMELDESLVLTDQNKSKFIKELENSSKKHVVMESSRILDSLNEVENSGVYSIENIPPQLAEYFNYGSELEEPFASLAAEYISNKQIFIDTENPSYAKAAGWVHIAEIEGSYHLYHVAQSVIHRDKNRKGLGAMLEPKDIIQGGFGDCYFLSAIAAIVQDYPELVYRLFVLQKNPSHIFGVRLFIDGIWRTIPLDGCFPVNNYGTLCGAQPHHRDIWVMLLEKAWAKVYKSFENIHSGYNEEGLLAISGAPTISLSSRKEDFLKLIQIEFGKGSIVTCATSKEVNQLTNSEQEKLGVFAAHAYTILKVYTNLPYKDSAITLIKIRNPWGKKGWKGDWSFKSSVWTNQLRQYVGYKVDPADGTFFISQSDFIMYFDHINISKVNLGYRNSHVTNEGSRYSFCLNKVVIKTRGDYYFTLYQENPRKYKNSAGILQKSKSWMFIGEVQSFTSTGAVESVRSLACSAMNYKDNTIETTMEPGVYFILSQVQWNYWDTHPYTITSYGPSKVQFGPGEVAPEMLVGRFIASEAEKIISLGGATMGVYQQTNISKHFYFDHHQGIGFITITNHDAHMIEISTKLQPCVGIKILEPYSMPLQLSVMPYQTVTVSFLVDPSGYNYRMHESYKLFAVGH